MRRMLALALLLISSTCHASPSSDPRTKRSYPLSEFSILGRVGPREARDRSTAFTFELGHGFNLGERYSIGGTVFVTAGDDYADLGIRPRFRRWLGERSSIDFAPGIILAQDQQGGGWRPRGPGFVAQVALNHSKYMGVVVQAHTVRRSGRPDGSFVGPETQERDTGVMLGLRVGGTLGLLTALGFLGVAIFAHD